MALRVLVADDDAQVREVLRWMLHGSALIGHDGVPSVIDQVTEASNGLEAVESYLRARPDLVLMDIVMPVRDGIEATREIMGRDPSAVVLAISAFSSGNPATSAA